MVPDHSLSRLFCEVSKLPDVFDDTADSAFVEKINLIGLHGVIQILTQDEVLIVALLSLHATDFFQILNRFKSRKLITKQRSIASLISIHVSKYLCRTICGYSFSADKGFSEASKPVLSTNRKPF